MPNFFSYVITNPDPDASETVRSLAQNEHTISEKESSVDDFNHQSRNASEEIRRRTRALTIEDGLGPTEDTAQREQDGLGLTAETDEGKVKKLAAVKVTLFDSTTSFLGIFVPLFTMIFGFLYMGKCPANSSLPYMVFIIGLLSLLLVRYALQKTSPENFVCLQQMERMRIEAHSALLQSLWICEVVLFVFMNVSFDPSADNYCDCRFYYFTIFMNIFFVLGFKIGMGLLFQESENLESHLD